MPNDLTLLDAVQATREISRDPTHQWVVELESGRTIGALDIQWRLLLTRRQILSGADEETDWLLESWRYTLDALPHKPETLIGGVDWISKKWLLEAFRRRKTSPGTIPGCRASTSSITTSIRQRGLFFGLQPAKRIGEWNNRVRQKDATFTPPGDTRASGRAQAVAAFRRTNRPYVINWDSIACESHDCLVMGDPFQTYPRKWISSLAQSRTATSRRSPAQIGCRSRASP